MPKRKPEADSSLEPAEKGETGETGKKENRKNRGLGGKVQGLNAKDGEGREMPKKILRNAEKGTSGSGGTQYGEDVTKCSKCVQSSEKKNGGGMRRKVEKGGRGSEKGDLLK